MRAEEKLLFELARAFLSHRRGDAARLSETYSADLDWERFVALAEQHHLTSIAYRLATAGLWTPPNEGVEARLRKSALEGALANAILERESLRVISALRDAGVRALVYKGLVLGASYYGDTSLRPHQDLDLMLASSDVGRAAEVLGDIGYEAEPALARATSFETRHWCEHNFDKRIDEGLGGAFHVELHWRVLPAFTGIAGDGDSMVPRGTTLTIGDTEVRTLDPVDHLLALALHGAKHRWSELRLVLDVALLVDRLTVEEVQKLHARAGVWRVRRMLALALALAERLGARSIRHDDMAIDDLVSEVEGVLHSSQSFTGLRSSVFLLRCLDGWRDVARYLAAHGRSEVDRHAGIWNAASYAVVRAITLLRT